MIQRRKEKPLTRVGVTSDSLPPLFRFKKRHYPGGRASKAAQADDVAEWTLTWAAGAIQKRRHRLCSRTATSASRGPSNLTAALSWWLDITAAAQCLAKSRAEMPQTQNQYRAACRAMNASCAIAINCTRIPIAVSWLAPRTPRAILQMSPSDVIYY